MLEVLRSGQLSLGPRLRALRAAFAARLGAPLPAPSPAGRRAAPRAAGGRRRRGDEVVTSPFSFVASANAAIYERARPVFADIDPCTLNLDPEAAAAARTERTRGLLPVHIFGYPADIAGVRDAAARPDRRGRLRGARRRATATVAAVGAAGNPAVFGSTRTSS